LKPEVGKYRQLNAAGLRLLGLLDSLSRCSAAVLQCCGDEMLYLLDMKALA